MIITVPTWTLNPKFQLPGSSGTIRLYYTASLVSDGVSVQGSPVRSKHFFDEMTWTLVSGVMTIATFANLISTTNSREAPDAQVIGEIYVGNTYIGRAFAWRVPDSYGSVMTKEALDIYNNQYPPRPPQPGFLDADQIGNLIAAAVGNRNNAALGVKGVTALTLDPVTPSLPIAVGDNDLRIAPAGAFYYASHYDSFADALVSMGNSRVRLIVSEPMITGNGTVPATVQLEFVGDGMLTITTGTTLTVLGLVIAGPVKIFNNALSGQGTVSFSGNTVQTHLSLRWWGTIVSTSVDQAPAINAALAALQSGMNLVADVNGIMRVESTLLLLDRFQVGLRGAVGVGAAQAPLPTFKWYGADGGTVLRIDRVRDSFFENFQVLGSNAGGSAGADIGISVTQDGAGTQISSNNKFTSVASKPNSLRSGWIGVKVTNVSGTNNEQHEFSACDLNGQTQTFGSRVGTGLYLGHSNVKEIIVDHCTFVGLDKGIKSTGNAGSLYSSHNNFTSTTRAFEGNFGDASYSLGDYGEDGEQILVGQSSPFTMISPRFADLRGGQAVSATTTDSPVFSLGTTGPVEVRGGTFAPISGTFTDDFLLSTDGQTRLIWKRNVVAGITDANLIAGLDTCIYSEDDVRGHGIAVKGALVFAGTNEGSMNGATPSLLFGPLGGQYRVRYGFGNGGATTVTNFTDGYDGQVIILKGDGVTTLQNNANIKTLSGADITPWGTTKVVMLYNDAGVWRQLGGAQ